MSPVTLAVVDDTAVMSTRETAYKTKKLAVRVPPQFLWRLGAG